MRQSGVIAAAGVVALKEMVQRLPEDHHRAATLAQGLAQIDGVTLDPASVMSNIVIFQTEPALDHVEFIDQMAAHGVRVSNYGTRGVRMVTHYQISDDDVQTAISAAREVLSAVAVAAD